MLTEVDLAVANFNLIIALMYFDALNRNVKQKRFPLRSTRRHQGDGRHGGRGGGDKVGNQRLKEIFASPEHCHLLRRVHQEEPAGKR